MKDDIDVDGDMAEVRRKNGLPARRGKRAVAEV